MDDLRAGWALTRRGGGALIGLGLLLPIATLASACLIGIPFLVMLGILIVAHTLATAREAPRSQRGSLAAAVYLTMLVGSLHGCFVVLEVLLAALLPLPPGVAPLVGAACGPVFAAVLGVAHAPFVFAPWVATDPERPRGFLEAAASSFELGAREGARSIARFGALVGLLLLGPAMVPLLGEALLSGAGLATQASAGLAVGFVPFLLQPVLWVLAAATVAARYVALTDADEADRAPAPLNGLRVPGLILAPVLLATLGVFVTAMLTPAPMRQLDEGVRVSPGEPLPLTLDGEAVWLPGTEVTARLVSTPDLTLHIEAADGGGAGAIDTHLRPDEDGRFSVLVRPRQDGVPGVVLTLWSDRWSESPRQTVLDRRGVRVDDGPAHRLQHRVGPVGGIGFVAALLALLGLGLGLARRIGQARGLDAPALDAAAGPDGRLHALEARLVLGEGAEARVRRGRLEVEGDARIEDRGHRLRLRLDRPVPVVGLAPEGPLLDGAELAVLSRFEGSFGQGLRAGVPPWPTDGAVVLGGMAAARDGLVRRAARQSAPLTLLPVLCLLLSTLWVVAHW